MAKKVTKKTTAKTSKKPIKKAARASTKKVHREAANAPPKEGDVVVDPTFGRLVWNYYWEGAIRVPLVNKTLDVWIGDIHDARDRLEVEPWHREAWSAFTKQCPRSRWPDALATLYTHAKKQGAVWSKGDPFIAEELKPILSSEKSFAKSMVFRRVSMGWYKRRKAYITIEMDCDFDPEHGLMLHYVVAEDRFAAAGYNYAGE